MRAVVAGVAQHADDALRLAQRIGADQVRPLGKLRDRGQQLADLALRRRMAEHRQRERRLGDEHVAGDRLEGRAGRVGLPLVVARGDDPEALAFSTAICAEPRTCPAGWNVTRTSPSFSVSPYAIAWVDPAKPAP